MPEPLPPLPGDPPPLRPLAVGGLPPLPQLTPPRPPQEIEDRSGEARRITARLRAIIDDHLPAAARLGVTLDSAALNTIIDALIAESHRQDPAPILAQHDEIHTYVLTTLYEELLEEPSNILHTTRVSDDVIRYQAMDVDFWRECLALLREQFGQQS
jgi:hypothetical protein